MILEALVRVGWEGKAYDAKGCAPHSEAIFFFV